MSERDFKAELESVRGVYEADFSEHGVHRAALGVPKGGQEARYQAKLDIGVASGDSLLDVGCGFGGLLEYAGQRGVELRYTGVDICVPFIDAARSRHPGVDFRLANILEQPPEESWDWVVLVGTLNLKLEGDASWDYVVAMLRTMFELCRRGIAVDFLSTYVDFQKPHAFHCDPLRIFDFVKRELSPRVALRHDYMAYEFTLHVYKDAETDGANVFKAQRHADPRS